ncbi:hypothetical protein PAENIP36_59690 [Paenibacillus sp. P36]
MMYGFLALVMFLSTILLPLSSVLSSGVASAHEGEEHGHKVLAISKTTGFRHASIDQGAKVALPEMAKKYGFEIDFTENAADINAANLAKYDVVFFVSTTGNFSDWGLTDQQKQDFMNFIKSGKGYVGAHSATDTGYDWQEYGDLTGAYFSNHPWTQTVKFNVEDSNNPATAHLGPSWTALEEVYYFKENPRDKGKHILLSLDMNSNGVTGGPFEDHPNAWCSPVQNGRMFYTALGHHPETWFKEDFQQHLLGGLKYAWGEATDTDCDQSSPKGGLQKVSLVKGTIASPVGIDISKSGEIFVISLFGKVYTVSQEGDTKEILNIPTNLEGEHGLLGIALDPDFDSNHYIYLYYTNPVKTAEGQLINNVSRFTYENGGISGNTEKNLLKVTSDVTCCHQAGHLKFGPDGKLYLTIGDNNTPTQGPQTRSFQTSQNLDDMRGKILRFNKDGSASNDNPFFTGQGGARDYVYAWGFRNPYRISFDTTKGNGKTIIYEGDVGPDGTFAGGSNGDYDEFNAITAPGQNFGWPYGIGDKVYNKKDYAGANNLNEINDALYAEKFATTKKPIAFYPYTNDPIWGQGGRTALAGPVYDYTGPNAIPGLKGKFLAYDFTRNWVKAVTTDDNGEIVKVEDFLSGMLAPIDMKLGPDGALYIAEFGKSWESDEDDGISKVFYGQLHRNPVIKAKASVVSGKTPLTVNFDTTGTTDLDGDTISFAWNFGDGTTSQDANPSHTYSVNGNYDVTLTVTNGTGKFSVWNTKISAGNTAPVVKITSPATGSFFTNGETITASAFATDEEDGPIACDKIQWSVNLLHDAHYHPFPGATGCTPTFTLFDDGHGPEAKIAWNIAATVTDNGATGTTPLTSSASVTFKNKRLHAADFAATGGNAPTSPADQGVKTEDTQDMYGGKNVGFTEANDWLMFKDIDMSTINKMYFRMASDSANLNMEVHLDSPTGEKVAAIKEATTKGWQNWKTFSSDVTHVPHNVMKNALSITNNVYGESITNNVYGQSENNETITNNVYGKLMTANLAVVADNSDFHDVYFVFPQGGNNINWIQFASLGDAAPTEGYVCNKDCGPDGGTGGNPTYDPKGALSRTNWVAKASHGENFNTNGTPPDDPKSCLNCAFDGELFSRWSTGTVMKAGMWYQVDLGADTNISRVLVDFGSLWTTAQQAKHPDYFRGYQIQVSTDAENWTTVASADTNTDYVVDKTFGEVKARYVRIVNTKDDTTNSWYASIHELYVFLAAAPGKNWTFTTFPRGGGNDASNPSDVNHVIDGKMNTRWDTGEYQKPGEWFQVNMGAVSTINEVVLDASGHTQDYPRGYIIEVSSDGQTWKKVAENANNTDVKVVATFSPVNAQYVKITQTGSSTANYWSIDEMDIKVTDQPVVELDAVLTSDAAGRILSAGDEVKVTVSAKDAKKLFASKLMLTYDASKLEYVSSALNSQFGKEGDTAVLVRKEETGKLSMVLTALGDFQGFDGNVGLVDITFKLKADGAATLSKGSDFSDVNGKLTQLKEDKIIAFVLTNPDVDNDGKLTVADLVAVAKAFGKTSFDPRYDLNHDGVVNIEDIAFVARKLLE